ncbi:MAG: hypothetical protein QN152_09385 [Armatimonadota bacterium]|nr:hypothetical protein [Armatimonadota bacterium]MDR7426088.1 hypothetical protein [Armatimonadota bacterium]MDR7464420.1 hypothetical protein [Armatimonadota bacterium]MDR7469087.1 hypothetical protein [Armatimonadota bacterium]MDR7474289.1 hypothetical protein [Armatimonadota bacterium]
MRVGEQIEQARRARSHVMRAVVNPPAVYKEKRYVLQAKLVVWAEDVSRALQAARELLAEAGLPCRTIHPSARALTTAEVPPPSR